MKVLKNIFTVSFSIAFATVSAFAAPDCKNAKYRAAYPEKCAHYKSNNTPLLAIAGGAALVGAGVALAMSASGNSGQSSSISNQNTFPRLALSTNITTNYELTDNIKNKKVLSYGIDSESDEIDIDIINQIKNSDFYKRNAKQYNNINFAYASARGFTGKNININIVDNFNSDHGNTVYEIAQNIAGNANITKTNIGTSDGLGSYDYIANKINNSTKSSIYNASWQIESTNDINAARATYNNDGTTKTYAAAQQYMYNLTSENFITTIRNTAIDNDAVFVWAAGNDSKNQSGALSALPLAFPELMGHFVNVVAVDNNQKIAWYSNQCGITQNYCIAAPGSAWNTDTQNYASGTSFAAPTVSGAVATIKEAFPYMKAEEITQLLFVTAKDLGETGVDSVYGWGLLDMEKATRPVGTPRIVLSNENIQPFDSPNVSGSVAAALRNANIKLAFIDDFGRAFTTNLSDNINVIPYGRGFEKLKETDDDSIVLFDKFEFGFKQNHFLESAGLVSTKGNNLTNFIGYKNEFDFHNVHFYQNARIGITNPTANENSIVSGFSNIYTASMKMGAKFEKLALEIAIPDTIVSGNMFLDIPVGRANNGNMIYNNTNINMAERPSIEYTIKYGFLSATFVDNPYYQNEVFFMAKTKFAF